MVRVSPPWTWALLCVVVCGLGAALAASFVGEIEVTGRARGILRPTTGVRVLTSQLTGTVVAVEARSGDHVKPGATILRIESAAVQGQLLEADRELQAVRGRFSAVASQEDHHYAEQIREPALPGGAAHRPDREPPELGGPAAAPCRRRPAAPGEGPRERDVGGRHRGSLWPRPSVS